MALVGYLVIWLMEPGVIGDIMTGEMEGEKITPELLLMVAIIVLAPLVMAFMSLTLRNPANRWANIIVGIVFVVLQLIASVDAVARSSAWMILMEIAKLVAPALIIWYAWKSKQEA